MLSQLSTPIIPTLPEQWSDWELTELIGAGTYGTVYKAQKKNDPNCVSAIKIINFPANENEANILLREHRGDILSASNYCSQLAEEFQREAEILHTLADCEHVVAYQDFLMMPQEQQIGQTVYIQMEYLNSFSQYCVDNELQESDVIRLGVDICTALSACHKKGIIHRDIKPDNIMVSKDGKFKLGDFGVAKTVSKTLSSLSIKGTFTYMAPEVYFGQKTNKKADIYSVGIMLYRLMNNNRDPFIDTDKKIVYHKDKEYAMQQRMSGEPLPFPVTASPEFGDIILKACAFDRKKRYKTADEFLSDLKKLQQNKYYIKKKRRQLTKLQKRLIYCIMSVAVILGAALGVNQAVEFYNTIDKGSCGESADWTLYRDSRLVIEGTGATEATEQLSEYTSSIKTIEVKDGITEIGPEMFLSFENVTDIHLPETVDSIGHGAFANCSSLVNINLPDNLTEIEDETFAATAIKAIEIPVTVTRIGSSSFLQSNLESINIPDSVTEIGSAAFMNCAFLQSVRLSPNTTKINHYTFLGCEKLKEINIPKSIHYIGKYAFSNCVSLNSVEIPNGVEVIDNAAFASCESLEKVILSSDTIFAQDTFTDTIWYNTN